MIGRCPKVRRFVFQTCSNVGKVSDCETPANLRQERDGLMFMTDIYSAEFNNRPQGSISSLQDSQEKFQRTLKEWERFVSGAVQVDKSVVPPYIEDSWLRSRKYGIDPHTRPIPTVLTGKKLQDLLEKKKVLITSSLPFMENLHRFVNEYKFIVALYDSEGYVLAMTGNDLIVQPYREGGLIEGSIWTEEQGGTTAIGTVMEVKKPICIHTAQHYCKEYHNQTAYGAPIFDHRGEFMGGIFLGAWHSRIRNSYLGMVVSTVKSIENELRVQKALNDNSLANSFQKAVIAAIPEALITIDNSGFISMINKSAKKMFSLHNKRIEGKHIRSVFGVRNERFLNLINQHDAVTDMEVRIFTNDQENDYTLTSNPILCYDGKITGKVLILNEIRRAKTLVTKMIGARANFRFEDICGNNPQFLKTLNQAQTASQSSSNVLLLGKSGTGKDIIAQAIHNASGRDTGPYVAINCAAIPRDLITSELFGYTEGSFTGSRRGGCQGKFELADGGTIFLDEIAETPLELQAVLLRVIEDKHITRIGGEKVKPVDVRIIAATNKDLKGEVEKGNFREDLYYRLNVFTIQMVPLCERLDDIPLLVDLFVKKSARSMGKNIEKIDPKIIETFMNYSWPGNVRELQNVIERMMNYTGSNQLTMDLIPSEIIEHQQHIDILYKAESMKDIEYQMLVKMLSMNLSKKEIAQKMKIARSSLYRKLKQYGLE